MFTVFAGAAVECFLLYVVWGLAKSYRELRSGISNHAAARLLPVAVLLMPLGFPAFIILAFLWPFPYPSVSAAAFFLPALLLSRRLSKAVATATFPQVHEVREYLDRLFETAFGSLLVLAAVSAIAFGLHVIDFGV